MSTQFLDGIDLGGQKATNAGTPTTGTDLSTKQYVDDQVAGVSVSTEAVQGIVGGMVTGNSETGGLAVTYDDPNGKLDFALALAATARILGRVTAGAGPAEELTAAQVRTFLGTLNADTLGGDSKATIIASAVSSIVNGAPTALDTLNELATALGSDANFASTVTTALNARVQQYDTTVGDGSATSITVTHNLNTKKVMVQLYETANNFEQVWCTVRHPTVNTITLIFATAPTAGQYTCVVQGKVGA